MATSSTRSAQPVKASDHAGQLIANDLDGPAGQDRREIVKVHTDRAGVGKNSVNRDQRGDRREHRKKCEERDPGGDGDHPVLADGAI